jgi:sulfate adenylyltransferase subunit 1 (EFTu-like GTPase family)
MIFTLAESHKEEIVAQRGYRTVRLPVKSADTDVVPVRMSPRRADALEEMIKSMSLFHGVKLLDIMEAVYDQGRKDGARAAFDALDNVKKTIPHRAPGRPRKRG